jgi:hypothetical protein
MAARVEEAVAEMTSDDFCLVHCFDNIAYMARSEEGGISLYENSPLVTTTLKVNFFS